MSLLNKRVWIPGVAAVFALAAIGIIHASVSPAALQTSTLIKSSGNAVYYYASDGNRYVFPYEKVYKSWFVDFSKVITISDADMAKIKVGGNITYRPGSKMVKVTSSPTVYVVDVNQTLRPIFDESAAISMYGELWNRKIDDMPDVFFVNYNVGPVVYGLNEFDPSYAMQQVDSIEKAKGIVDINAKIDTSVDLTAIPLGDGKYSSSARVGYIYSCQTNFNGGGAQKDGDWIHGDTWDKTEKINVQGNVSWSQAQVSISKDGTIRTIVSNDLPTNHHTGTFPISSSDPAYEYDRNPNHIAEQSLYVTVPAQPSLASAASCVGGEVGISTNGVLIFNGFDAEGRDAAAHEIQDSCDGHPQEGSYYHYHSGSDCFDLDSGELFGYAFDGYGIYYEEDANGNQLTNADLDECHGRTSEVMWDGQLVNMYHYVLTQEFPFTVGCFKGTALSKAPYSQNSQSDGAMNTQGQTGTPPQEAINACASKTAGQSCSFQSPNGTISGQCVNIQGDLACKP